MGSTQHVESSGVVVDHLANLIIGFERSVRGHTCLLILSSFKHYREVMLPPVHRCLGGLLVTALLVLVAGQGVHKRYLSFCCFLPFENTLSFVPGLSINILSSHPT